MLSVWDHDGDGVVNIRDFIHTFAYAQLVLLDSNFNDKGTENDRLDYIFRTADCSNDGRNNDKKLISGVLTFEDIKKNVYFILKNNADVDPETVEELAVSHTRSIFEDLKADMTRGITHSGIGE